MAGRPGTLAGERSARRKNKGKKEANVLSAFLSQNGFFARHIFLTEQTLGGIPRNCSHVDRLV